MATPDQIQKMIRDLEKGQSSLRERVTSLEAHGKDPKPDHWLKRNAYWIALVVAISALFFGSGSGVNAVGQWVDKRIETRIDKPLQRLTDIEKGVIKTNEKLDLIYDLWKDQLKRAAQFKPADFKRHLPEITDSIKAASILKISTPPGVDKSLKTNFLATDSAVPGNWPAVSQFISYRSVPELRSLPSCFTELPKTRLAESIDSTQTTIKITNPTYEDCEIDLSAQVPSDIVLYLRQSPLRAVQLEFHRCKVIYRGGAIPLLEVRPRMAFLACMFEIVVPAPPPAGGRGLVFSLLSALDLAHVDFDGLG